MVHHWDDDERSLAGWQGVSHVPNRPPHRRPSRDWLKDIALGLDPAAAHRARGAAAGVAAEPPHVDWALEGYRKQEDTGAYTKPEPGPRAARPLIS